MATQISHIRIPKESQEELDHDRKLRSDMNQKLDELEKKIDRCPACGYNLNEHPPCPPSPKTKGPVQ